VLEDFVDAQPSASLQCSTIAQVVAPAMAWAAESSALDSALRQDGHVLMGAVVVHGEESFGQVEYSDLLCGWEADNSNAVERQQLHRAYGEEALPIVLKLWAFLQDEPLYGAPQHLSG